MEQTKEEKRKYDEFMTGLRAEVKQNNKFNGRRLAEQSEWDAMDEATKDELVAWVLGCHAAFIGRAAYDAIHEQRGKKR